MSTRAMISWTSLVAFVMLPRLAPAQAPQQKQTLHISGYAGAAPLVQLRGRTYVDLEALARITNGSLSYQGTNVVLTPSLSTGSQRQSGSAPTQSGTAGFSRDFMKAGVEAIAAMREWGSTLKLVIQNGYPPGNAMTAYQGRAADSLRLASVAVANDSDRSGFELLNNEFNNVQAWSNELVSARNSMNAASLTTSKDALENDPSFQKIVGCGKFLISMFASGKFQDDATCH
jgi:hypothetical protein